METIRSHYYCIVFIIHDMLISDIYFVNSTAGVKVPEMKVIYWRPTLEW